MMRNVVGPQVTAATILFGEVLSGAEAERVGLAWRCVPDDALRATALELAGRAASAPRELVERIKASIGDMGSITSHAEAVERELGDQVWSIDQPAFAEKLAALRAKISRSG
jgi:enoyl-CoA hydratase